MHILISKPGWNEKAYTRACSAVVSASRAMRKSMEHANLDRIVQRIYGDDRRFRDATADEVALLTSEQCRQMLAKWLRTDNLEVRMMHTV
jgi:hypothetical protein